MTTRLEVNNSKPATDRAVVHDMEAIFGATPRVPVASVPAAATPVLGVRARHRSRFLPLTVVGMPLLAVGLATAALAPHATPAATGSALRVASATQPSAPVAMMADAPDGAPALYHAVDVAPAADAPEAPARNGARMHLRAVAHPRPARSVRPRLQVASMIASPRWHAQVCAARDLPPRSRACMMAMERSADRALRGAYLAATRAGVSRRELVAYRNEWNAALRREQDRPHLLVASYSDLTRRLYGSAETARGGWRD